MLIIFNKYNYLINGDYTETSALMERPHTKTSKKLMIVLI